LLALSAPSFEIFDDLRWELDAKQASCQLKEEALRPA
jgi:hypothetical protein